MFLKEFFGSDPLAEVADGLRESERLRLTESLLSLLVESTEAAVFIKDTKGRYLFVNQKCEELWSAARRDIIGKTDEDVLPRAFAEMVRRNDEATLKAGRPMRFEEEIEFSERRHVFLSLKMPLIAKDGSAFALCGIATDITEQNRIDAAIRESEARFRALADSAPVLIWVGDAENEGVYFNRTWLEFTGRTLAEECGNGWLDCVHSDDLAMLDECLNAFEARRPFQITFRLRRRDGVYRWMLDTAVPRWNANGEFTGFVGSMIDVTDTRKLDAELRKRTEELAERDRRKDELLSMLGHELRNPLAAVRGAVDLIKMKRGGRDIVDKELGVLDRQLGRLTRLVDDLLDVARVTRGRVRLVPARTTLQELVGQSIEGLGSLFEKRRQRLVVVLPAEPVSMVVDPTRISQVFMNLLSNASKFSAVEQTIHLEGRSDEAGIEIEVSDQGKGLSSAALERVFEPFVQMEHDYHGSSEGLGLGLTLVRALVEMHEGSVWAHSAGPGKGAAFFVRLPLCVDVERSPAPNGETPAKSTRCVLVVDDNVDSAELIVELLRANGHVVVVAHDGRAAIDVAEKARPNLAIVDLALPILDGLAVARALRARYGEAIRLVALTGYGLQEDRRAAREAGFDEYLVKPVGLDELLSAIG